MSLFQCKEKDGTINMRVCGYLTKEPKSFEKVTLFSVCYGKKKYMDVKVWASNKELNALALCLEHHDTVDVSGVYETYVNKENKEFGQIVADFITVLQQPPAPDYVEPPEPRGDADAGDGFKEINEEEDDEE